MKEPKDRALDILYKCFGGGWSKGTFSSMLADPGDTGQNLRKWLETIEAGIREDRRACISARAPS